MGVENENDDSYMITKEKAYQLITELSELDILDYKQQLPDTLDKENLAELIRDIIAIANAAFEKFEKFGYLIFGVENLSRNPIDISGQCLFLKPKSKDKNSRLDNQQQINDHNQKQFVKIAKDYIEAITGITKVSYITFPHPTNASAIVGVLEISGGSGPYTVKKSIQRSNEKGNEIQEGEAWTRDGEDKRQLSPKEILELRNASQDRKKIEQAEQRAKINLGNLFGKWSIESLEIPEGSPLSYRLSISPLETYYQLSHCYFTPLSVSEFFDSNPEKWHLNHLIISGDIGTGKTSTLNFLAMKREKAQAKGKLIIIKRIPTQPDISEFIEYLEVVLRDKKITENIQRTIIFDLALFDTHCLDFIHQIGSVFPHMYIWISCKTDEVESLKSCIETSFSKEPKLIHLAPNLRKEDEYFKTIVDEVFGDSSESLLNLLKNQIEIKYTELARLHSLHISGIPLIADEIKSQDSKWIGFYSGLSFPEQIILKIIYLVKDMRVFEFRALLLLLNVPFDTFSHMIKDNLIYLEDESSLSFSSKILIPIQDPYMLLDLNTSDITFFLNALENYYTKDLGYAHQCVIKILDIIKNLGFEGKSLSSKLLSLRKRFSYDFFCGMCNASFSRNGEHCPNCGGEIRLNKGVVAQGRNNNEISIIPFPNSDLIVNGTFEQKGNGINQKQIDSLINKLNLLT